MINKCWTNNKVLLQCGEIKVRYNIHHIKSYSSDINVEDIKPEKYVWWCQHMNYQLYTSVFILELGTKYIIVCAWRNLTWTQIVRATWSFSRWSNSLHMGCAPSNYMKAIQVRGWFPTKLTFSPPQWLYKSNLWYPYDVHIHLLMGGVLKAEQRNIHIF